MQRWLADMWTRHRWTVLLITHDVREAVHLSDRIYVLSSRPAHVARQFHVPLKHPRQGVGAELAAIEAEILQTLLHPET